MIHTDERIRYPEDLADLLEKLGREIRAIIRQGLLGRSVLVHPMEAELCRYHGGYSLLHRHNLSQIAEAIRHNQDEAMPAFGRRQGTQKIHFARFQGRSSRK